MHQALITVVNEFDRVFDGEDVLSPRVIDVIEKRCKRGCFA